MEEDEIWTPPADAKEWTPPSNAKVWEPPVNAKEIGETSSPLDYAELTASGLVSNYTSLPLKALGAIDEMMNNYVYRPLGITKGQYTSPASKWGADVAEFYQPYVDQETQNSFGGQVAQGLGTGLAMLGTGGASALTRGSGLATQTVNSGLLPTTARAIEQNLLTPTGALGGAMTAVPEYEAAKAAGLSDDDAFGVLVKNYLVGQTEALPIQNMFGKLNKITGGTTLNKVLDVAKVAGTNAVEEGLQEGVQTYLSNEIAKSSYDPDRDPFWGVARAATVGGVVGMILPGIGATISTSEHSGKIEKKVEELHELAKQVTSIDQSSSVVDDQISPEVAPLSEAIDNTAQNIVTDLTNNQPELSSSELIDKKVAENEELLAQDNLNKAKGGETLSTEERQKLEEENNTLQGKENVQENETSTEPKQTSESEQQPSPEYTKALEEISNLSKVFAEQASADPTADLSSQYEQLLKAREAAAKLAPAAKTSNKKSAVKSTIENTTGVTKPEKSVRMTPSEAIKHQVQTFYRGMTKGVRKGQEGTKELVQKVQDALKEYNLTPRQVGSILSKLRSTNLFTAGSVSRLNDFITKVTNDSVYADKIERANELRGRIKKRKGSEGLSWREKDALKSFSKVDPSQVDIDQYLKQAEGIAETFGDVKNRKTLNLSDISNYVSQQPNSAEVAERERAEKLAEDLGLSFEEAQILLTEETPAEKAAANKEKAEQIRTALQNTADQAKNTFEEGEIEGDGKYAKDDIEGLKNIDLSLLTNQQLKDFIKVVDRIHTNEDWGGVGRLTAISKAQQDFKELQKVSKDWKILNITDLGNNWASLPVALQAITGLPKNAALFQLYMGMKGVGDASVKAVTSEEQFVRGLDELRKKYKKAFQDDSIIRQGIYSELIRYNEDEDPTEALAQNKRVIEQSIENHRKVGEVKEADRINSLYEPFKNALTISDAERIMGQVDEGGKKVIDYAIDYYRPFADEIAAYNDRFFNKKTTKVNNYSGPRTWRKKGMGFESDMEEFGAINPDNAPSPFTSAANKPKQISSAKEFTGGERTDAVLDFNKHMNMTRGVKNAVFGIEGMLPMLQVRENLSRQEDMAKLFGAKEGDPDSIKKANDLYNKIFNKRDGSYFDFEDHVASRKVPDSTERNIAAILNPLRKIGYTLSLSGFSQIPKQLTVLSNIAINSGNAGNMFTSIGDLSRGSQESKDAFFKGESISLRGTQKSQLSLGELTGTTKADQIQKNVNDFVDKRFEGWLGLKPLVWADVSAAKVSYLTFYKDYLQQNGEKWEGFKKETEQKTDKVRQEARAYAKQRVDALQVVSNPAELGKRVKDQSAFAQVAKALLVPFGTFSTNTKIRMWGDIRSLVAGNSEQKKAAAKDLAGTVTEQVAFQTVSAALKIYVWSQIGQYIAGLFDLPEDKKRGEKDWENAINMWKANMVGDLLPIVLTDPGQKALVSTINDASDRLLNYKDPLYEYKGGPTSPVEQIADIMGPYGAGPEKLFKAASVLEEGLSGERRVGDKIKKLTPEQQRFTLLVAALYGLNINGKMPSDVVNAIDRERRLQKPGKRKYREPQINYINE